MDVKGDEKWKGWRSDDFEITIEWGGFREKKML
jgi:hypothetical protein